VGQFGSREWRGCTAEQEKVPPDVVILPRIRYNPANRFMERLGTYQVVGEVGRGGMGVVYRAVDPIIQRAVALKVIRLQDIRDPEERATHRERLFREARSAGILSHPAIVTVYQVGEENEVAYIAMEFVNGPTLDQLLAAEPRPKQKHIFAVLRPVATALDYAHNRGVIHRDIKPTNIMIGEGGAVKITDFGVAKITASSATLTGLRVGTPFYMSPEQVQGKPVDGRTDQYSLAIVAYQMFTGERPHKADTLPTLMYKIITEQPEVSTFLIHSVGEGVGTVLCKALSKSPDARFRTCTEFIAALEAGSPPG